MRKFSVPVFGTTKTVYTRMSKSAHVIARRPCGFITEITNDNGATLRRMYIEHDGEYFTGIMLPYESVEDFMESEFHGVETEVKAKFSRSLQDA